MRRGVEYLSDDETNGKAAVVALPEMYRTPRTTRRSISKSPNVRSSERIRQRQTQSFQKPKRQELFDKIVTSKSPSKLLSCLKPRPIVNNLLRETHRYNYDPYCTSGESSIEDFIVDDEDDGGEYSSSSKQSSSDSEQKKSVTLRSKKNIIDSDAESETTMTTENKGKEIKVKGANYAGSDEENLTVSGKTQAIIKSDNTDSSDSYIMPSQKRVRKKIHKPSEAKISTIYSSDEDFKTEPQTQVKRKLVFVKDSSTESGKSDDDSNGTDVEDDASVNKRHSVRDGYSVRRGEQPSTRVVLMQQKREERKQVLSDLLGKRKKRLSGASIPG